MLQLQGVHKNRGCGDRGSRGSLRVTISLAIYCRVLKSVSGLGTDVAAPRAQGGHG